MQQGVSADARVPAPHVLHHARTQLGTAPPPPAPSTAARPCAQCQPRGSPHPLTPVGLAQCKILPSLSGSWAMPGGRGCGEKGAGGEEGRRGLWRRPGPDTLLGHPRLGSHTAAPPPTHTHACPVQCAHLRASRRIAAHPLPASAAAAAASHASQSTPWLSRGLSPCTLTARPHSTAMGLARLPSSKFSNQGEPCGCSSPAVSPAACCAAPAAPAPRTPPRASAAGDPPVRKDGSPAPHTSAIPPQRGQALPGKHTERRPDGSNFGTAVEPPARLVPTYFSYARSTQNQRPCRCPQRASFGRRMQNKTSLLRRL